MIREGVYSVLFKVSKDGDSMKVQAKVSWDKEGIVRDSHGCGVFLPRCWRSDGGQDR